MNKIVKLLKRIIFSALLLYSYNLLAESLNLIIPINIVTISILTILGVPSLFFLIAIMVICF